MLADQAVLAAARTAANAINQRHQHDGSAELMPVATTPGPGEMAGLLDYMRSHPMRDRRLAAADACDALAILRYLDGWAEGIELAMLRLGHDSGQSWLQLAKARGWRSKQAAQQRRRRLADRRAAQSSGDRADPADASRAEAWLAKCAADIVSISEQVAAAAMQVAEAEESAEVLEAELASRTKSLVTLMNWLTIVLNDLAAADGLTSLAVPVRQQAARLAGEWRNLQG